MEAKGWNPSTNDLTMSSATASARDVIGLAGRLFRCDVSGLFSIYPAPDAGNPERILLHRPRRPRPAGRVLLPRRKVRPDGRAYGEMSTMFRLAGAQIQKPPRAAWWGWKRRWPPATGTT